MGKYKFSMQIGNEVFTVDGCDSYDEAIKIVEKGVYDRKLKKEKEAWDILKIEEEKRKRIALQEAMEQGEDADKALEEIEINNDAKPIELPIVKPEPSKGFFGKKKF